MNFHRYVPHPIYDIFGLTHPKIEIPDVYKAFCLKKSEKMRKFEK
jgi:hypothetical protein